MKCRAFLDWLKTYWLIKKDSAAWSEYEYISAVKHVRQCHYRPGKVLRFPGV